MSLYKYLGAIKDIYELGSDMKAVFFFLKIALVTGEYPYLFFWSEKVQWYHREIGGDREQVWDVER